MVDALCLWVMFLLMMAMMTAMVAMAMDDDSRQQQQRGRNSHLDFNKYDYSTHSICASFKCDNLVNIVSSLSGYSSAPPSLSSLLLAHIWKWMISSCDRYICGANVKDWKWSKRFYMEAGFCGSNESWTRNTYVWQLAHISKNGIWAVVRTYIRAKQRLQLTFRQQRREKKRHPLLKTEKFIKCHGFSFDSMIRMN